MSKWIKKDDKVIVLSGNHKGSVGKVLMRQGDRVVIEGVNLRKKHVKRTREAEGGIVTREFPIHISNVAIVNLENRPVRLKVRFNDKQQKELYYLNGSESVVYRTI